MSPIGPSVGSGGRRREHGTWSGPLLGSHDINAVRFMRTAQIRAAVSLVVYPLAGAISFLDPIISLIAFAALPLFFIATLLLPQWETDAGTTADRAVRTARCLQCPADCAEAPSATCRRCRGALGYTPPGLTAGFAIRRYGRLSARDHRRWRARRCVVRGGRPLAPGGPNSGPEKPARPGQSPRGLTAATFATPPPPPRSLFVRVK